MAKGGKKRGEKSGSRVKEIKDVVGVVQDSIKVEETKVSKTEVETVTV